MPRTLHVLMPMGGAGARFQASGETRPKPIISIDGMPMFCKAMQSLHALDVPMRLTAIVRQETQSQTGLAEIIPAAWPGARVVIIPHLTRGAVETCAAALPLMQDDEGVLVLDCDLWFESPAYCSLLRSALHDTLDPPGMDAALLTFPAAEDRYSFACLDGDRVVRVAEKQVISNAAILGAYYFNRTARFRALCQELLSLPPDREYYLSHLYALLLAQQGVVTSRAVTAMHSFGTPEELASYRLNKTNQL